MHLVLLPPQIQEHKGINSKRIELEIVTQFGETESRQTSGNWLSRLKKLHPKLGPPKSNSVYAVNPQEAEGLAVPGSSKNSVT